MPSAARRRRWPRRRAPPTARRRVRRVPGKAIASLVISIALLAARRGHRLEHEMDSPPGRPTVDCLHAQRLRRRRARAASGREARGGVELHDRDAPVRRPEPAADRAVRPRARGAQPRALTVLPRAAGQARAAAGRGGGRRERCGCRAAAHGFQAHSYDVLLRELRALLQHTQGEAADVEEVAYDPQVARRMALARRPVRAAPADATLPPRRPATLRQGRSALHLGGGWCVAEPARRLRAPCAPARGRRARPAPRGCWSRGVAAEPRWPHAAAGRRPPRGRRVHLRARRRGSGGGGAAYRAARERARLEAEAEEAARREADERGGPAERIERSGRAPVSSRWTKEGDQWRRMFAGVQEAGGQKYRATVGSYPALWVATRTHPLLGLVEVLQSSSSISPMRGGGDGARQRDPRWTTSGSSATTFSCGGSFRVSHT